MKRAIGAITTLVAVVVLLSGCGPATGGPAASVSDAQPSPAATEVATTTAPPPSPVVIPAPPKP